MPDLLQSNGMLAVNGEPGKTRKGMRTPCHKIPKLPSHRFGYRPVSNGSSASYLWCRQRSLGWTAPRKSLPSGHLCFPGDMPGLSLPKLNFRPERTKPDTEVVVGPRSLGWHDMCITLRGFYILYF